MATAQPSITALPPYPQLLDSPADFVDKADAHVKALPTWTNQVVALGRWMSAVASETAEEAAASVNLPLMTSADIGKILQYTAAGYVPVTMPDVSKRLFEISNIGTTTLLNSKSFVGYNTGELIVQPTAEYQLPENAEHWVIPSAYNALREIGNYISTTLAITAQQFAVCFYDDEIDGLRITPDAELQIDANSELVITRI